MNIGLVQGSAPQFRASTGTTITLDAAAAPFTVGNTVFVSFNLFEQGVGVASIVVAGTAASNDYQVFFNGGQALALYRVVIVNSGRADVVINLNSSATYRFSGSFEEFDNVLPVAYDVAAEDNGGRAVTTATTTQNDALVYGVFGDPNFFSGTVTPSLASGYNIRWGFGAGNTPYADGVGGFKQVTTTGTQSGTTPFDQGFVVAYKTSALPSPGNLVARWSAGDITPQTDNTTLAAWTDSVGSIAATQATGAQKPFYRTYRLNNLPSVQFVGGQFLDVGQASAVSTALNSQESTIFIVWKTNAASNVGSLLSAWPNVFLFADGTNAGSFYDNAAGQVPYPAQKGFSTLGVTSTTNTMGGAGTGLQRVFLNGGCLGSKVSPSTAQGAVDLCIGSDVGLNFPINAEIFEVVVWNAQLTPTQLLQAQMWACDKYAQPYPWATVNELTIFHGDSITAGVGCTNNVSETYPYKAAQTLGLDFGQWSNLGIGGIDPTGMDLNAVTEVDNVTALIGKNVHLAAFEWYNQQRAAPFPQDRSVAYMAARRALTPFNANLTTVGTGDWAHWGDGGVPGLIRKASGGSLISAYTTVLGGTAQRFGDDPRALSWTDGSGTVSSSNNLNGLYVGGVGEGFTLTVPAGTTTRTVTLYVGGWASTGTFTAHLSDSSAADYTVTTSDNTDQYANNFSVSFRAASAGQTLTLTWSQAAGYGNVTLEGVALTTTGASGSPLLAPPTNPGTTKVCFGTSTDTSATTDVDRAAYDAYFDANHSSATMDAYVAIHLSPQIGVETANVDHPANFYDGIHLTPAGYTPLATLMAAGLRALAPIHSLDSANPLAAGLISYIVDGFDLVTGLPVRTSDGSPLIASTWGPALQFDGTNHLNLPDIGATGSVSMMAAGQYTGFVGFADFISYGDRCTLRPNNGSAFSFYTYNGSSWDDTANTGSGAEADENLDAVMIGTHDANGGMNSAYTLQSGVSAASYLGASPRSSGSHTTRLGLDDETARSLIGWIAVSAVWGRALTTDEANSLLLDPRQLILTARIARFSEIFPRRFTVSTPVHFGYPGVAPSSPTVTLKGYWRSQYGSAGVWGQVSGSNPISVTPGSMLVVLASAYNTPSAVAVPTDSAGTFVKAANTDIHTTAPETFIATQVNATGGNHTITPFALPSGDEAMFWIVEVTGMPATLAQTSGNAFYAQQTNQTSGITTANGTPVAGNIVFAIHAHENSASTGSVSMTDAPVGWISIGVDNDGTNNLPTEACWQIAPSSAAITVNWTTNDAFVYENLASIASFTTN